MPKPIKVPIIREYIQVDTLLLNEFSKYVGVTRQTIKKSGGTRLLIWLASKGYDFEIVPVEELDESTISYLNGTHLGLVKQAKELSTL